MQSRLLFVPRHESQNRAYNSDLSSQNTSCNPDEMEEHPLPFRFGDYLQPVLQTLIQNGKIRHALSKKGKLLEQFNREQHDSDAGLSAQEPNQKGKGCRGKLKMLDKAQKAYGREHRGHLTAMAMNAITGESREQAAEFNEHEAYHPPSPVYQLVSEEAGQSAVPTSQQKAEKKIRIKHPSVPDIDFDKRPKVTGVSYDTRRHRWRVDWRPGDGKKHDKYFSVGEHGAERAYQLAVQYRQKMVEEGIRVRHPAMPDSDFDKRPKVAGVGYDTGRHRWRAIWCEDGVQHIDYFPVGEHGAEKAYQLAVQHRQKMVESGIRIRHPSVPDSDFNKRPKVTGVCYHTRNYYWQAYWYDEDRKMHTKHFSVGEHGAEEAYQLAVQHRRKMVEEGARVKRASMRQT